MTINPPAVIPGNSSVNAANIMVPGKKVIGHGPISVKAGLRLYFYFISRWNQWRDNGMVDQTKSTLIATIFFAFMFLILNGFEPFFPVFRFAGGGMTSSPLI